MVVYQNGGFTPAWSVSQWWLAGAVFVDGANVVDRRNVKVLATFICQSFIATARR